MSDRFTEKAENALNRSVKIAENLGHTYIGTEHILLSLAKEESSTGYILLKKNGAEYNHIIKSVEEYSGVGEKSRLSSRLSYTFTSVSPPSAPWSLSTTSA